MTREPNILRDGLLSALGGVDSGRVPLLLQEDQLGWAENVTCRGGYPDTRPPFYNRTMAFENTEQQDWFENHKLQGADIYQTRNGDAWHIAAIGGRLFTVNPDAGYAVREVTPISTTTTTTQITAPAVGAETAVTLTDAEYVLEGYPIKIDGNTYIVTTKTDNTITIENVDDTPGTVWTVGTTVTYLTPCSTRPRQAWFQQAQEYMVIQDRWSRARIYNGTMCRWSVITTATPEVPTGGPMAYSNGRLWVAIGQDEVAAGDIVGGDTLVINFTEENVINGGGRFRVSGNITALVETAVLDTSLGQGPLQVFTADGAYSINVPINRELWQSLQYPIQTVSLKNSGAQSQYSAVLVNSDIFYRGTDGLRSLVMANRDFGSWGNTPISDEMNRVMRKDHTPLLYRSSAILFDNRLLFTAGPMRSSNGVWHRYLGVLDFRPLSTMREKAPPVYEGVWTGIKPTLLVSGSFRGRDRAFAWCLDDDNKNVLVELVKEGDSDDGDTAIDCSIETRAMVFQNPLWLKKLMGAEMFVDNVAGSVTFDLSYRPDQYPCWMGFGSQGVCVTSEDCDPEECTAWSVPQKGHFVRLGFSQPSQTSEEPHNERPARTGYDFQFKLDWTGKARLLKLVVKALNEQERPYPPNEPVATCRGTTCCP